MSKFTTITDIRHAADSARTLVDARNALIAYAVLIERMTQKAVAAETGVDAGDVSRIVKMAKAPDAADVLGDLVRTGPLAKRMEAAATYGARFLRRQRPATPKGGKSGGTSTKSRKPATDAPATDAPTTAQSPRDILAALAVLVTAAQSMKWSDTESADLSVYALQLADLAAAD